MKRTIVLTGGGTAGHVIPNLALLPELEKNFEKIIYIGTENGIEAKLVKDKLEYEHISASKLIRSLTPKNLLLPVKLIKSVNEAKAVLKKTHADVVFSKGGFVAVPVVIAAKQLKIPVISHESDLSMGLANKIIYHFCKKMCVSFEKTAENKKKCVYTGSPIRNEIFLGNKNKLDFKFNNNKKIILIFGGSLGAKNINNAIFNSLEVLTAKYNICHIVGKGGSRSFSYPDYVQKEFVNNMEDYFHLADFVISRAGANSLFELLALHKPMLLIPLSKKQSRGDQIENANYFKEKGYAHVLQEENLNEKNLLFSLEKLETDHTQMIDKMKNAEIKNANKLITDIILNSILSE